MSEPPGQMNAMLPSEDEAREVARIAVSQWLTAKGLRSLSAAQVNRLANNKRDDDDLPAHFIQSIARAYMVKDTDNAVSDGKGGKLKSVNDIVTHFKLAKTSAQAFANEQASFKTIANMPDIPAPVEASAPSE